MVKKNKLGIVIVSYNASDVVNMTLSSVRLAKNQTSYKLILVDNASNPVEFKKIQTIFNEESQNDKNWELMISQTNLGFSGGNNLGISKFLIDEEITHICLLNSDVIVSDYWIDRLLEKEFNIVSCVTNKADSEQCVPCNYDFSKEECITSNNKLDIKVFNRINDYSQKWYESWSSNIVEAEPTYFCVVISKKVFQQVGLLDETFFPGGFEDDDYCIRSKSLGFTSYLARDVFMHHWGSGSFGQLQHQFFSERAKKNKAYLETKHNIVWKRRPERPFVSFFQDLQYFLANPKNGQKVYLKLYVQSLNALIEHYTLEYTNLKNMLIHSAKTIPLDIIEVHSKIESTDVLLKWKDITSNLDELKFLSNESIDDLTNKIHKIVECNFITHDILTSNSEETEVGQITESINHTSRITKLLKALKLFIKLRGIVFFAGYPYPERENDGYFQRIKAIDSLFVDRWRIYIEDATNSTDHKLYDRPAHNTIVIRMTGSKKRQLVIKCIVFLLVLKCRAIYYHSVLRMQDTKNWFFMLLPSFVKKVIDIHGVVPEEFRYHDDFYSAVLFEKHEQLAVKKANIVITVTNSMQRYFQQKYRENVKGRMITLPIFPSFTTHNDEKSYNNQKPVVVYAGGLHKWQQTPKMIDAIGKTLKYYSYRYYCPHPEKIKEMMGNKRIPISDIIIESKTQTELFELYRECHYGLVLREDIVVNHVACPTKLIEYIAMGIIPIFDTEHIGDFHELGLKYITLDDFEAGNIPTEELRNKMAKENNHIVEILKSMRYEGSNELYDFLTTEPRISSRKLKDWAKSKFPENSTFGLFLRKAWHRIKSGKQNSIQQTLNFQNQNNNVLQHFDIVVQVENFLAGGLENVVLDLNKKLIDEGYSVLLLVLGEAGKAVEKAKSLGMAVHVMPFSNESYQTFLDQTTPKLIMAHYSWKGFELTTNRNLSVIQVVHNVYMWFDEDQKRGFQESSNHTKAYICVSDYAKEYTIARLGIEKEKCFTIPNGVEIQKFLQPVEQTVIENIKKELNIQENNFVFLNVGSINHQKNQLSLVKAFKNVASLCANAKLILLGPIYEQNLFEEIQNFITSNNLQNKIVYAGSSSTPEVYYKIANAYVHSANFEGGQLSLVEYLLGNKPIVSTNIGFCQHVMGLNGIKIVLPHIDILNYYGKIWEIPSSQKTIDELSKAMIEVYNKPIKPNLSKEIIEAMDCSNSYNIYVELVKDIISGKGISEQLFDETWTRQIEKITGKFYD